MSRSFVIRTLIILSLCANTAFAQSVKFTVTGNIQGIQKGDTLRFSKISLPSFESEKAFDIIADKDESFKYSGTHPHTQYYIIQYFPVGTPIDDISRKGMEIIIKDGNIKIEGRRDYIYYSTITNSFYDKELTKIKMLEDSLELARNMIYNAMSDKNQDPKITMELYQKYSTFPADNAAQYKRLESMRNAYNASASNEYKAYLLCTGFAESLDNLEAGYNKLDNKARKSYYGTLLQSIITKLKKLAPGEPAPGFTLTTRDEEKISLADFKGKYLLIYLFGTSFNSVETDPYIVNLYKANKDKLEVIGLTESMDMVNKAFDNIIVNGSSDMKKGITSMLIHPWKNKVELEQYDNKEILDTYSITGIPFFILISPDGKIAARGFFEAFNAAKAILSGAPVPGTEPGK